jgi:hypothetical protein
MQTLKGVAIAAILASAFLLATAGPERAAAQPKVLEPNCAPGFAYVGGNSSVHFCTTPGVRCPWRPGRIAKITAQPTEASGTGLLFGYECSYRDMPATVR